MGALIEHGGREKLKLLAKNVAEDTRKYLCHQQIEEHKLKGKEKRSNATHNAFVTNLRAAEDRRREFQVQDVEARNTQLPRQIRNIAINEAANIEINEKTQRTNRYLSRNKPTVSILKKNTKPMFFALSSSTYPAYQSRVVNEMIQKAGAILENLFNNAENIKLFKKCKLEFILQWAAEFYNDNKNHTECVLFRRIPWEYLSQAFDVNNFERQDDVDNENKKPALI